MFVVRPVTSADIPALQALTETAPGVHTLPRTLRSLGLAVERSLASFAAQPDAPADESYFFVLESPEGAPAGTAVMAATAGASGAFFAFRRDVLNQVSRDLGISHDVHMLTMCSDLTGHSQLSGFHLLERLHAGPEAALLSRARLLFAASAPQRFREKFFVSMPGIVDDAGRSPFWEALGRKFFQLDLLEAERMIEGARNRTLIVELMPHYPVYVPLLPADAQAAMGKVHADGELAFRILSEEGFEADGYIDIFDGGPILRARRHALRTFSQAMSCRVAAGHQPGAGLHLVATARPEDFRAVLVECVLPEGFGNLLVPEDAMRALRVGSGDEVLCMQW